MPDGYKPEVAAVIVTVPNMISLARLCAVPLAVWLVVRGDWLAAFWLFVVAGLSDAVDGWLARMGARSKLGAVLDPLADKLLLVSMYVVLAAVHVLPVGLSILVVFRDLLIVGGILLIMALGEPVLIAPLLISKLNTALQLLLVALALGFAAYGVSQPVWLRGLAWLVAVTTFASGVQYVRAGARMGRHAGG